MVPNFLSGRSRLCTLGVTARVHTLHTVHSQAGKALNARWKWTRRSAAKTPLKGQCHEIFCFWFFSWISFPQAPEYSIKTISNFFEKSQRYSPFKVYTFGINDTGGKFSTSFASVVDTGGKSATGVNDAGGKLPPMPMTPAANLRAIIKLLTT